MKRILLSLCLFLIMCAPWTMGQQVMTPQYSTYTSFSTDSSGVITTTVTVQGTTQINPSCTYCYSAWHSPKTVNQFTRTDTGAVLAGGLTSGPGVQPPSQQINYTSTTTFNPLDYSDQDWTWTSTTSSQVFCSVVGQIYAGGTGGFQAGTPSQHAYTQNPLPSNCRISQYYDAVRNHRAHHAEDVVLDDGRGGGIRPQYGTPVFAAESGTVTEAVSGRGPSQLPYPQCAGTGAPGNYVRVRGSDGYSTTYFHVTPTVSTNQQVTRGQQIGVLDDSGCQSGAHLHMGRRDPSGHSVNFSIPCVNPFPTDRFFDGLVDDSVPDYI